MREKDVMAPRRPDVTVTRFSCNMVTMSFDLKEPLFITILIFHGYLPGNSIMSKIAWLGSEKIRQPHSIPPSCLVFNSPRLLPQLRWLDLSMNLGKIVAISRAWCGFKEETALFLVYKHSSERHLQGRSCIFCPGGPNSTGHHLHLSLFMRCFFHGTPKLCQYQADPIWMYDWRILEDHDTDWEKTLARQARFDSPGYARESHGCPMAVITIPFPNHSSLIVVSQWSSWLQEWLERRGDRSVDSQFAVLSSAHPTGPLTAESGWATQMVSEVILIEGETPDSYSWIDSIL